MRQITFACLAILLAGCGGDSSVTIGKRNSENTYTSGSVTYTAPTGDYAAFVPGFMQDILLTSDCFLEKTISYEESRRMTYMFSSSGFTNTKYYFDDKACEIPSSVNSNITNTGTFTSQGNRTLTSQFVTEQLLLTYANTSTETLYLARNSEATEMVSIRDLNENYYLMFHIP